METKICKNCGKKIIENKRNAKYCNQKCYFEYKSKNQHSYDNLYKRYCDMKSRCYNKNKKNYKYYGGRGIKVCDEWKDNFKEFYNWAINGWKKGLTLDRINNDDDYKPDNCRWVDRIEQANNRHTNYLIKYKGRIKTMAQWSRILKIDYSFIQIRMYKNKTMEEVVKEWNLKSKK